MGIFNMMRTSVSGMSAQSDRLGAISDNVANAGTIGYKKGGAQFSDLLHNESFSAYQSGSVETHIRYDVTVPGAMRTTSDVKDLSISGSGFFLVTDRLDGTGEVVLTRAGDFRPDKNGNLRNSAGFYLLTDADNKAVANVGDTSGKVLEKAAASTKIQLSGNLPYDDKVPAGTPFDPKDSKTYNLKRTVHTIGKHGQDISVDVYFVKVTKGWEILYPKDANDMAARDKFNAIDVDFNADNKLVFRQNNNELTGNALAAALKIKLDGADVALNLNALTISGQGYEVAVKADGQKDGKYKDYTVNERGELLVVLDNGHTLRKGLINIATVAATDKLLSASGTVFKKTSDSGDFIVGLPSNGSFGSIKSQQLEQSNVDIATELTDMIEAQRTYTSNSKVFQAGSEMMDAVLNMVR